MRKLLCSLLTLALMAAATVVMASDEEPKAAAEKVEVGAEQPFTDAVPQPRLTVEEQILQDIKDIGRETVADLVAQLPGQATAEGRADLQRQIEAAKVNNRIELLNKIIEFAVANGDEPRAAEARRILDITRNGPQPVAQQPSRPAPAQNQGGQR